MVVWINVIVHRKGLQVETKGKVTTIGVGINKPIGSLTQVGYCWPERRIKKNKEPHRKDHVFVKSYVLEDTGLENWRLGTVTTNTWNW